MVSSLNRLSQTLGFLERGYHKTTMSMISERCGGSKSTLWAYFDTKPALFLAAIKEPFEKRNIDLQSLLAHSTDIRASLIRYGTGYIAYLNNGAVKLAIEAELSGDFTQTETSALHSLVFDQPRCVLSSFLSAKTIPLKPGVQFDPPRITTLFLGLIDGLVLPSALACHSTQAHIETVLSTMLASLIHRSAA